MVLTRKPATSVLVTELSSHPRRRRRLRPLVFLSILLLVLLVAASGGIAWYFSSLVLDVSLGHHRSPSAVRVRAVVLNSPVLDYDAEFDLRGSRRSLPGVLTALSKWVIARRIGLPSLDSINQIKAAASLKAPTLLFHGTADTDVPISSSIVLARVRPDLVTFVPVVGAEHTQEWTAAPAAYAAELKAFLTRVLRTRSASFRPAMIAVHRTTAVRIYLIAIGDAGRYGKRIGCGDSLVGVTKHIPATRAPLSAAVRALLSEHHRYYGQSGLYNALYRSRLTLKSAAVRNGRATIRLTGRLQLGGVCDDPRVAGQLKQTARQFRSVHRVAVFVNNVPLKKLLSEKGQ